MCPAGAPGVLNPAVYKCYLAVCDWVSRRGPTPSLRGLKRDPLFGGSLASTYTLFLYISTYTLFLYTATIPLQPRQQGHYAATAYAAAAADEWWWLMIIKAATMMITDFVLNSVIIL